VFDVDRTSEFFPPAAERIETLHISLSKAVSFSKHELEPFKSRLCTNVRALKPFPVTVDLESPTVLQSDSGVSFGCFPCVSGKQQLSLLVDAVDDVMEAFGKAKYYEERLFHVSVVSWPNGLEEEIGPCLNKADTKDSSYRFHVDRLVIRSGHLLQELRLQS
jgi:hypothetical protein